MTSLFALDLVFKDMGNDIARIASLGDNADLLFAIGQIVGQINAAIAVPYELFGILRFAHDAGLVHHGPAALAEADDHIHPALLEQLRRAFSDFIGVS